MVRTRPGHRSAGTCEICGKGFEKAAMTRHLASCWRAETAATASETQGGRETGRTFHLVVEGQGLASYWIHLAAPAWTTLESLDRFLRKLWLECCGHLSAFSTAEVEYLSEEPEEPNQRTMRTPLREVLRPGMALRYEYDFGSTTELSVRVIAERPGAAWVHGIVLLAQNDAPRIPCASCGRRATRVCAVCVYGETPAFCRACMSRHGCGPEMFLPLLNSPRAGVCAYGHGLRTQTAPRDA